MECFDLLPQNIRDYLNADFATLDLAGFACAPIPNDKPCPVTLAIPPALDLSRGGRLLVCADGLPEQPQSVPANSRSLILKNLCPGKTCHCRLRSAADGGLFQTTFETQPSPVRMLDIEGIRNVRDAGGWKTRRGSLRRGLLYRGSEMNERYDHGLQLAPDGLNTMRRVMQIATDIDLRNPQEAGDLTQSPLGDDVRYLSCPVLGYLDAFRDEFVPALRTIFQSLAQPQSYPVYMHCWAGADRTGTVIAILKAALGVSYRDITRDYELSAFSIFGIRGRCNKEFKYDEVFAYLEQNYPAENLEQSARTFLLQKVGLSLQELEQIYSILVCEDAGAPADLPEKATACVVAT